MTWIQEDNSSIELKVFLRKRYLALIPNPEVLDLFCGLGEMYRRVYGPAGVPYLGVDHAKVHDPALCVVDDNMRFVRSTDISQYNYFDLDHYGCPWLLFYLICKRYRGDRMVVVMTDGAPLRMSMSSSVPRIIRAIEGIPANMRVPLMKRFYVDVFCTMLKDVEARYGFRATKAEYIFNPRASVCYWGILLERESPKNGKEPDKTT
jgi:hypothetical protein